ncbi:hypothetical protein GCM10009715_38170 [Paeniglutamicibacter psychrophenolicus]
MAGIYPFGGTCPFGDPIQRIIKVQKVNDDTDEIDLLHCAPQGSSHETGTRYRSSPFSPIYALSGGGNRWLWADAYSTFSQEPRKYHAQGSPESVADDISHRTDPIAEKDELERFNDQRDADTDEPRSEPAPIFEPQREQCPQWHEEEHICGGLDMAESHPGAETVLLQGEQDPGHKLRQPEVTNPDDEHNDDHPEQICQEQEADPSPRAGQPLHAGCSRPSDSR